MTDKEGKPNNTWEYTWDRIFDVLDTVVGQVSSGRWIFTVAAALVIVHACWNDLNNAKEFKEIIAVIIYAYFNRNREMDVSAPKDKTGGTDVPKDKAILPKPIQ